MYDIYILTQAQLSTLLYKAFTSGNESCYDLMESEVDLIYRSAESFRSPKKIKEKRLPLRIKYDGESLGLDEVLDKVLPITAETKLKDYISKGQGALWSLRCPSCEQANLIMCREKIDGGIYDKVTCPRCSWASSTAMGLLAEKIHKVNRKKND